MLGGNSWKFGDTQLESSPRARLVEKRGDISKPCFNGLAEICQKEYSFVDGVDIKYSDDEVRPINTAVKVWKCIG